MTARLILEDEPGAWVEFTYRKKKLTARMDPMWLGPEKLLAILERPRVFLGLLDSSSQIRVMTLLSISGDISDLLESYLDAVGLSFYKLAMLKYCIEDIELVEVDFLRLGLDVRDWLNPEGPLSTRRVVALYQDLLDRPETQVGAKRFDVKPLDKSALAMAMRHNSEMEEGKTHPLLKSPGEIEREQQQRRENAEKRERMRNRDTTLIPVSGSGESFESSRDESLRMLEEIKAKG